MSSRFTLFLSVAISLSLANSVFAATVPSGNLLLNSEFSSGSPPLNPWLANGNLPWTPGVWNAEDADLIIGSVGAISPHSPNGMIRANRLSLNVSQVSQIIDVSAYATAIDTGNVYAKFSVWVNGPINGIDTATFLRSLPSPLRPSIETRRREDPMLGSMSLVGKSSIANVWQQIEGVHPLAPNTRFLHFEFYGTNATIPNAGVFFDSASVTPIPEPASGIMVGCLALMIGAWKASMWSRRPERHG